MVYKSVILTFVLSSLLATENLHNHLSFFLQFLILLPFLHFTQLLDRAHTLTLELITVFCHLAEGKCVPSRFHILGLRQAVFLLKSSLRKSTLKVQILLVLVLLKRTAVQILGVKREAER
jgi:hypothetical protein